MIAASLSASSGLMDRTLAELAHGLGDGDAKQCDRGRRLDTRAIAPVRTGRRISGSHGVRRLRPDLPPRLDVVLHPASDPSAMVRGCQQQMEPSFTRRCSSTPSRNRFGVGTLRPAGTASRAWASYLARKALCSLKSWRGIQPPLAFAGSVCGRAMGPCTLGEGLGSCLLPAQCDGDEFACGGCAETSEGASLSPQPVGACGYPTATIFSFADPSLRAQAGRTDPTSGGQTIGRGAWLLRSTSHIHTSVARAK